MSNEQNDSPFRIGHHVWWVAPDGGTISGTVEKVDGDLLSIRHHGYSLTVVPAAVVRRHGEPAPVFHLDGGPGLDDGEIALDGEIDPTDRTRTKAP